MLGSGYSSCVYGYHDDDDGGKGEDGREFCEDPGGVRVEAGQDMANHRRASSRDRGVSSSKARRDIRMTAPIYQVFCQESGHFVQRG
jgi:hypothetical protein